MDCGPTCLRMVARHYGHRISLQALREKTQIGKAGVSLLGIGEAAEAIGFRTRSVKLSYDSLVKDAQLPAILYWEQVHFVILYKVKKDKLFIADPAKGLTSMDVSTFKRKWIGDKTMDKEEGIALLLSPGADFYRAEKGKAGEEAAPYHFKNIFSYLTPYRKLVLQLFIGLGVASLIQLFLPFLTQSIVDTGISTANIHFVYIILLAQVFLFAGRLAVEFVRGWILLHISTRITISIITDFLIKLMKLPLGFFDSKHTGDILQRMNDHRRIESFLTGSSLNVLFSIINLFVFCIALLIFNKGIFTVFVLSSVLYACWVIVFMKRRKILEYSRFDIAAKEQSIAIQLIQGMQEIKLNGAERPMRWGWESVQARLFRLNMRSLSLNQWQQAGAFFINEGKNIFITFLSVTAVIEGHMTLGSMLAVQYIIGQLNSPIEQVIGFLQSWQDAKISLERLHEVHRMEDEEPVEKQLQMELPLSFQRQLTGGKNPVLTTGQFVNGAIRRAEEGHCLTGNGNDGCSDSPKNSSGMDMEDARNETLAFHDVSFTYKGAGNEPVLKEINLDIPKGKTTAIVGMSGSGKTTLLKLLLKFYEPEKGEIKLGSTGLNTISHRVWRKHCGVVMQDSFIFSDTIARNIAVGQEQIDKEQLCHAAAIANIREFIEKLPLGYNTKIGAEGMGISMGQKQRILIARSVYRNPGFIFFDEATNSLDANNETQIIEQLESFFKGRTVVVVAHRLSTVKHADQIVVLNKGKIAEKGTHQELISLDGEYYALVKNQLELGI